MYPKCFLRWLIFTSNLWWHIFWLFFLTTNNYFNFKNKIMGSLLYTIAVILVIIWAISFFGGFYTGGIVHILLVIAIIAILFRVISGRRPL